MRRILHVAGSPTNAFFYDLSLVYARGCANALAGERFAFVTVVVEPGGAWRFPDALDAASIARAERLDLAAATARLRDARADVALPQMFCYAGMTHYRALLELLGIPYLGNRPLPMAVAADKALTRAIVAAAGVDVPPGEVVRRGVRPTLAPPVVVKPTTSDNSDGISLVTSPAQFARALDEAYAYGNAVLVERYVELGREVRCATVVRDGALACLPLEEYAVDSERRPIRRRADKLARDGANGLTLSSKDPSRSWPVPDDDPIVSAVCAAAKRAHAALGCEQYGLFDFRIDPSGRPWFLEAGLYCSFSPQSVVATMAAAAGIPLDEFFAASIDEALRGASGRDAGAPAGGQREAATT